MVLLNLFCVPFTHVKGTIIAVKLKASTVKSDINYYTIIINYYTFKPSMGLTFML